MSPRLRSRPGTLGRAYPVGRVGLSEAGIRIVQAIHRAADDGRTGLLHLVGEPSGAVYLRDGRLVHLECTTTPSTALLLLRRAEEVADPANGEPSTDELSIGALSTTGWPTGRTSARERQRGTDAAMALIAGGRIRPVDLEILLQQAVADAATTLFSDPATQFTRTRFLRAEQPWIELSHTDSLERQVAEAIRRRLLLTRTAPGLEADGVPRPGDLHEPTATRLTPRQGHLMRYVDGSRSCTDLAWLLGYGVFATTIDVARLVRRRLLTF